jgi:hypothetical protein
MWAYNEAPLLGVWPTRIRPYPQRSAEADADLRGVVMVEVGKPSQPHGNCLAWPEYPPRWLVAPSTWIVKRNFTGVATGVAPKVIAAIGARRGVCAVVVSHHAPFLNRNFIAYWAERSEAVQARF